MQGTGFLSQLFNITKKRKEDSAGKAPSGGTLVLRTLVRRTSGSGAARVGLLVFLWKLIVFF
jgi:hypothetical protein